MKTTPNYDFLRLRAQVILAFLLLLLGIFAADAVAQSAAAPAAKQKATEQTGKLQIIGEVEPVTIQAAEMTLHSNSTPGVDFPTLVPSILRYASTAQPDGAQCDQC